MIVGSPPAFADGVRLREVDGISTLQLSPEGAHASIGEGRHQSQILFLPVHHRDAPMAAVIPMDADLMGRVEALNRFWRTVEGRPPLPDTRMTPQQRHRLRRMMLAADGRANRASYRDIAVALFGAMRATSEPWKTSSLRDRVIGLVKGGHALIGGGYLKLLRHRRRL